jgi:hypothetical protein
MILGVAGNLVNNGTIRNNAASGTANHYGTTVSATDPNNVSLSYTFNAVTGGSGGTGGYAIANTNNTGYTGPEADNGDNLTGGSGQSSGNGGAGGNGAYTNTHGLLDYGAPGTGGSLGSSGGCIYVRLRGTLTGTGNFNVNGSAGTAGGAGGSSIDVSSQGTYMATPYSGSVTSYSTFASGGGGGGGGGAGGSAGKIFISYVQTNALSSDSTTKNTSGGSGGGGGAGGICGGAYGAGYASPGVSYYGYPDTNPWAAPNSGAAGAAGSTGGAGAYTATHDPGPT